MQKGEEWER